MEQQICYDVLRIIFKYLESNDLYRASLVCRYWAKVASEENFARGPVCILVERKYSVINYNWNLIKNDLITNLPIIPGFYVMITVQLIIRHSRLDCHCKYLPRNCYSLLIEIFYPTTKRSITMNMSLPNSKRIQINTYTFLLQSKPKSVYCPELSFISGCIFRLPGYMKTQFKDYFVVNSGMKSCMILFCDMNSICLLNSFIISIQKWFPNSKLSIWVGLTKGMSVCKTFHFQRKCRAIVSFISFFISSKNLQTWKITWPLFPRNKENVKKKLEKWKQDIKLKKHCLAIFYFSGLNLKHTDWLECDLFSIIFPKVPYVYLYGHAVLMGEGFEGILETMAEWLNLWKNGKKIKSADEIGILLLSYD